MTNSDRLLESLYDLANCQKNERTRLEVVRIALLAAQHRAAQLTDAPARASSAGRVGVSSTRPASESGV